MLNFFIFFIVGGAFYCLIEIIWSGKTHPSMFIAGGLCFILINAIDSAFNIIIGTFGVCLLCGVMIASVEYTAGCLINKKLGMKVWDYSGFRFNAAGQVCLRYTVYWCLLSYPASVFAAILRGALENL